MNYYQENLERIANYEASLLKSPVLAVRTVKSVSQPASKTGFSVFSPLKTEALPFVNTDYPFNI